MSMQQSSRRSQREEISRCQLIASERFNVSLRVYKTIKALSQLAAVGAGTYAMSLGADPLTVMGIIGLILSTQEALEYFWANGAASGEGNGGADA